MVSFANGLIVTPALMQHQVSVEMDFQPSVGILARKVDKLGLSIRSFKEPLQQTVKQVMIPSIRRNFDSEGRPPWTSLAESTVLQRGSAHPILRRSGSLRRVMGYQKIWSIDSEKAMITDLPEEVWYGKVHQAGRGGTTRHEVKNVLTGRVTTFDEASGGATPARPFVMVQPEDEDAMERIFDRWLAERIARAGL